MPQLDYSRFARGGAVYPLTSSIANSLLQDGDPSLFQALAFFAAVCSVHFGARLIAEAAACGAPITAAVAQVVPFDPIPYLTQEQFQFPLLAISRTKAKYPYKTVDKPHTVGEWRLQYILPPLTAAQMERVGPVLKIVSDVIDDRITQGFDPSVVSASGTAASVTVNAGVVTISGLAGILSAFVNAKIVLTGAATADNDGAFFVATTPGATSVTVQNNQAATDANNGHISWSIVGVRVWTAAGLEEISLEDSTTGRLANLAGDIMFPTYSARLTCMELTMPVAGAFEAMAGIDVKLPVYDAPTATLTQDISDFKTDVTPPGR